MELLRQSGGVPVVFAVVTRTGHVLLEELTDAETSLDWELEALQAIRAPPQNNLCSDSPVNEDPASPTGTSEDFPSFDAFPEQSEEDCFPSTTDP